MGVGEARPRPGLAQRRAGPRGHGVAAARRAGSRPTVDDLFAIVRRRSPASRSGVTRLFVQRAPHGRFWSCFVYVPRDRYRTTSRASGSRTCSARRLGGRVPRVQRAGHRIGDGPAAARREACPTATEPDVDWAGLEAEVARASRSWDDDFNEVADALPSEERGVEFGEAYEAAYTAEQALADLQLANELTGPDDLRFALFKPDAEADDPADLRFKVITRGTMSLSARHAAPRRPGRRRHRRAALQVGPARRARPRLRLRLPPAPPARPLADWDAADRARFARPSRRRTPGGATPASSTGS